MRAKIQPGRSHRPEDSPGEPGGDGLMEGRRRIGRTARTKQRNTTIRIPGRLPRIQTILSQALFIIFLITFCLSFQKDMTVPAFSGGDAQVDEGPMLSPSIFDILWQRRGFSKVLLKTGFPMLGLPRAGHPPPDFRMVSRVHAQGGSRRSCKQLP
jgi:hypothetical protein